MTVFPIPRLMPDRILDVINTCHMKKRLIIRYHVRISSTYYNIIKVYFFDPFIQ